LLKVERASAKSIFLKELSLQHGAATASFKLDQALTLEDDFPFFGSCAGVE
jgi:hypothetical protein